MSLCTVCRYHSEDIGRTLVHMLPEEMYEVTFEYVAYMNGNLKLLSDYVDSHNGKTLQIFPLIIVICNLGLCEIESLFAC
jgi:hypothetical protein